MANITKTTEEINMLLDTLNKLRECLGLPKLIRNWTGIAYWLQEENNGKQIGKFFEYDTEFIGFLEGLIYCHQSRLNFNYTQTEFGKLAEKIEEIVKIIYPFHYRFYDYFYIEGNKIYAYFCDNDGDRYSEIINFEYLTMSLDEIKKHHTEEVEKRKQAELKKQEEQLNREKEKAEQKDRELYEKLKKRFEK